MHPLLNPELALHEGYTPTPLPIERPYTYLGDRCHIYPPEAYPFTLIPRKLKVRHLMFNSFPAALRFQQLHHYSERRDNLVTWYAQTRYELIERAGRFNGHYRSLLLCELSRNIPKGWPFFLGHINLFSIVRAWDELPKGGPRYQRAKAEADRWIKLLASD